MKGIPPSEGRATPEHPSFIVRLRLLPTVEGGRQGAIRSDYRPCFDIGNEWNGQPALNDGRIMLADAELLPGAEGEVTLEPLRPEYWDHVREGMTISVLEGARVVGYARVLERRWPSGINRAVAAFVRATHDFCEFVRVARTLELSDRLMRARRALLALYTAGVELPTVHDVSSRDAPTYPVPEAWPGFEMHDIYWEVFDPYEQSAPVAGSLSDDVIDAYRDIRRGLWHWDKGALTDAVWEWRFSFDTHWGDHAVDALRTLHRACVRAVDAGSRHGGA